MVIAGDFNMVRFSTERTGQSFSQPDADCFNKFIDDFELRDLQLNGGLFTWRSPSDASSASRIDRFLLSQDFLELFPDVVQLCLPHSLSDHNPILISQSGTNWGPKPFKFYNYWMDDNECEAAILSAGLEGVGKGIGALLRGVKRAIKGWLKNNKQDDFRSIPVIEGKIKELEDELDKFPSRIHLQEEIGHLQAILWDMYWKEERKWHQQSRLTWHAEGDRNTRFYQQIVSARRRLSHIGVINVNNQECRIPVEVKGAAKPLFFKRLQHPLHSCNFRLEM